MGSSMSIYLTEYDLDEVIRHVDNRCERPRLALRQNPEAQESPTRLVRCVSACVRSRHDTFPLLSSIINRHINPACPRAFSLEKPSLSPSGGPGH